MLVTYFCSSILNQIYNKKSEKKLHKLVDNMNSNVTFITNQMNNYEHLIDNYKNYYMEKSLFLLNKLLNN